MPLAWPRQSHDADDDMQLQNYFHHHFQKNWTAAGKGTTDSEDNCIRNLAHSWCRHFLRPQMEAKRFGQDTDDPPASSLMCLPDDCCGTSEFGMNQTGGW